MDAKVSVPILIRSLYQLNMVWKNDSFIKRNNCIISYAVKYINLIISHQSLGYFAYLGISRSHIWFLLDAKSICNSFKAKLLHVSIIWPPSGKLLNYPNCGECVYVSFVQGNEFNPCVKWLFFLVKSSLTLHYPTPPQMANGQGFLNLLPTSHISLYETSVTSLWYHKQLTVSRIKFITLNKVDINRFFTVGVVQWCKDSTLAN